MQILSTVSTTCVLTIKYHLVFAVGSVEISVTEARSLLHVRTIQKLVTHTEAQAEKGQEGHSQAPPPVVPNQNVDFFQFDNDDEASDSSSSGDEEEGTAEDKILEKFCQYRFW